MRKGEKTRRRVSKTGEGEGREGRERKRKKWGKRKEEKINLKFFLLLGTHAENYIIFRFLCQIVEHGGFYRTQITRG